MRYLHFWIWPGLAAVGCLTALAIWFQAPVVEADLGSRASEALRQEQPWAQVSLSGRDLTLMGIAPDEESQASAVDIARSVYGVREVRDISTLLPEENPYRLSIEKTAEGVIMSGFVPNETARTDIISALSRTLPGIALSDQTRLARGAPDDLVALAGQGLAVFPRLSTGLVEITDRAVAISGVALNPDDHDEALAAAAAISASMDVEPSIDIKPAAAIGEYKWSVSIGPGGLKLEGYVPDAQSRTAIASRADDVAGGSAVEDRMRLASGAPSGIDWVAAADEALSIVADLAEGSARISGPVLDLVGQARDGEAFRRIQARLSEPLSSGLVLGTADIGAAASTLEWTATRTKEGVTLDGQVPSDAIRNRLLEAAGLKFGRLPIEDAQQPVSAAPEGFEAAALAALQALSRLNDAEARISNGSVHVTGVAMSPVAARDVERILSEGLPDGFSAQSDVAVATLPDQVLPAEACQAELNRLSAGNTVLFETGKAEIRDHSQGFLDQMAFAARQCGEARLEISGHTDSDGSEADNLALSERRATAVLDFMIAAGVSAERMTAVGYGESRPLEGNETDAGKAANRRIEFRILE